VALTLFDAFWAMYPRKVGKTRARIVFEKELKKGTDPKSLLLALDKYRLYCIESAIEPKYIKHASTFMHEWEDWLDPEVGKTEDFSKKSRSIEDLDLSKAFKRDSSD
jgi:hypothetical protein